MHQTKSWSQLLQFAWVENEPRFRQDLDRNYHDILDETGLNEEELEHVVEVFQRFRLLVM